MHEKDYITITKKPWLDNSQGRDWKKKEELLTHISMKNITELNELIYAGAKYEI